MLTAMQAQSINPFSIVRGALQINRPLVRLVVLTALLFSLIPFFKGHAVHAATPAVSDSSGTSVVLAQATPGSQPLPALPADGLYLFGQAPIADQLGAGYMVFSAQRQQVVGVLYMPSSSFDCFRGELRGTELAMMITNSYTQEVYPYAIAIEAASTIASTAPGGASPLSLDGFHQLPSPSENDLRMLEICQNNL